MESVIEGTRPALPRGTLTAGLTCFDNMSARLWGRLVPLIRVPEEDGSVRLDHSDV